MKKFRVFLVMLALGLVLAGCNNPADSGDNPGGTAYRVTFHANGGSGAVPDPITVQAGSRVTLPDGSGLTKSNIHFGGWSGDVSGAGTLYQPGDSYAPTADITFYAIWTNTFTVTFNSNGGSAVRSQAVAVGDTVIPAVSTRDGYTLAGWYKESTFATRWNFDADTVTAHLTLYAKWNQNAPGTITVTFDTCGGSWVNPQNIPIGDYIYQPITPTRRGYVFDNWYIDADYTTYFSFLLPVTTNRIVYAKWTPITYTVIYDKNAAAAAGIMTNSSHTYDVEKNLNANAFTRTGYAFAGWARTASGAVEFIDGQSVKNLSAVAGGTVTLYAQWNVFDTINDLAEYLENAPDNTVDTPYDIILHGLNIETDFYQDNDSLYKLYNALNGKYVNLDLSDCEGHFIPNSSYGSGSRPNRDRIVSIILPSGITSIGSYAFYDCTSLALTALPSALTSIGNSAFSGCTSLALTALPSGITSIGEWAFYDCTSLALTALPSGVTSIGYAAFSGCTGLTSLTIPASVTSIADGYVSYSGVFSRCTNLTTVTFAAGSQLESIGSYAFDGCTSLVTVTFAAGSQLESIGDWAFSGCTNLALTALPAGVTSIGDRAFSGCTGLALTALPAGVTSIGDWAFYGCTGLALTALPSGLTSIGDWAFSGCTSLVTVTFAADSQLESIGRSAFEDCTGLALTALPSGVTSIGSYVFYGCTSLALVICHAVTPPTLVSSVYYHSSLQIKVPAGSVAAYKAASVWSSYASRIIAIDEYYIYVTFTGPTERVIPITRSINNNLSKSGGGSITLKVTEDFEKYEWFIGETKVATGKEVTLQANNAAFTPGSNWITVAVYAGTGPGATPYSGVFTVRVNG